MWSKECEQAFDEAKSLITSEQVLVHYDPDLPITAATESSKDPVMSKVLERTQQGWPT